MTSAGSHEIFGVLRKHQFFMIGCHEHPDGDAIGSTLALGLSLAAMGKTVRMVCPEGVPSVYHFLEGSDQVVTQVEPGFVPEVVIALDCADRSRLSLPEWPEQAVFINIDHHISNTGFGHLSYVLPDAAATGEIIADFLFAHGMPINSAVAVALYTAVATDTGFFRFTNTTGKTLRLAAKLVEEYDVPMAYVAERVHDEKSFDSLRLLAEVLGTLTLSDDGKVAWMVLSQDMLKRYHVELEETEGYVNYARSVRGVEIGLLFKEIQEDDIKVSWRSGSDVDVSRLAVAFGGGGHARAAGCTVKEPLDEAIRQVLGFVHEWYGKQQ
ncbi:MAG TPA: bifunctional oligoribonuclease/PAP phosphatase NrnA [Firmicutes bacterium]|nr:bifunctional oligoribonuclease/PAP phosphatase NrnA [Bacillota bacterium]HOQ23799.1 bifunctional oligoribonuclease/PAP phosphatase NrnA [Bacillota bacterium]